MLQVFVGFISLTGGASLLFLRRWEVGEVDWIVKRKALSSSDVGPENDEGIVRAAAHQHIETHL